MRTPTLLALLTRRGRPGNEGGQPETHAREMLDLLKLARLKAPAKEPVDLSQIVRDCMEYQRPPESVEVRLELAELPAVQRDLGQLLQVLVHLTSNALQAMP